MKRDHVKTPINSIGGGFRMVFDLGGTVGLHDDVSRAIWVFAVLCIR